MSDHDYRRLSEEHLLRQCRWEAFRGPGSGGQKRNKTSSAVRITHLPTGISATASELRSQARNKAAALNRLRHRMALELREPVDLSILRPPAEFEESMLSGKLNAPIRSERYLAVMAFVLDVLTSADWSVSEAARALSLTTGNLVQFLRDDEKLWETVNRNRIAAGLRPLVGE